MDFFLSLFLQGAFDDDEMKREDASCWMNGKEAKNNKKRSPSRRSLSSFETPFPAAQSLLARDRTYSWDPEGRQHR